MTAPGKKIAVLGNGVIGLATALRLLESGYAVTVFGDSSSRRPTSAAAAAFWYPFAVNSTAAQDEAWAIPTLQFYNDRCARDPASGVRSTKAHQYFDPSSKGNRPLPAWMAKYKNRFGIGFATIPRMRLPKGINLFGPIDHGWEFTVPLIDMLAFLPWMRGRVEALGGIFETKIVDDVPALCQGDWAAVANCTGIWSTNHFPDSTLYALQGIVIRLDNREFGEEKLLFLEHGKCHDKPVYIVPHGDTVILGGTTDEVSAEGVKIRPAMAHLWRPNPEKIREILLRCAELNPKYAPLATDAEIARLIAEDRVAVGLRPRRHGEPPRIEIDSGYSKPVIHNYGHGGAGVTMCWGTAIEVEKLIKSLGI